MAFSILLTPPSFPEINVNALISDDNVNIFYMCLD